MTYKLTEKLSRIIPARHLSWVLSLLGGSVLLLFWWLLEQTRGGQVSLRNIAVPERPGDQGGVATVPAAFAPRPRVPDALYDEDDDIDDDDDDEYEGRRRPPSPQPAPAVAETVPVRPAPSAGGVTDGIYRDGIYTASSDAPWGPMTVEITVSGGQWTAIRTPDIPDSPPSYYAVTYLVQQALAAQNELIDGVSGATYTSNAFRDDLRQIIQLSKK